jgi:hypothetical protein
MKTEEYEIISRAEAKAQGLKYYFNGEPCRNDMIALRRVASRSCTCSLCRKNQNEWRKKYRKANHKRITERERSYRRWYRKENYEADCAADRRYYERNREKLIGYSRQYRENNKEKVRDTDKIRNRKYHADNPEKSRTRTSKRRATKQQAIPSWFGEFDQLVFEEAYSLAALREAEIGFEWHVDHMVPLRAKKACGLHCADNIQVIPAEMNLSKNNKMILTKPLEWLRVWAKAHNVSMRPKTASKEESCALRAP